MQRKEMPITRALFVLSPRLDLRHISGGSARHDDATIKSLTQIRICAFSERMGINSGRLAYPLGTLHGLPAIQGKARPVHVAQISRDCERRVGDIVDFAETTKRYSASH